MDKKPQVIVVGGGAAGLTAGIMAARNGAAVTILEQNEKPGRKICVTGNGRCNLTNQEMSWEKFHGQNPAFVRDILSQFSLEDTLKFFDELGIVVTDKKGWLYPRGGQAKYIPELLLLKARSLKVKIKTREKVPEDLQRTGSLESPDRRVRPMRGLQSFSRMAPKLLPYRVQMEADMYLPGNSDIISSNRFLR